MAAVQNNSQMFTASGLTPDTAYSFQAAAVNSDGDVGPYSSPLEIYNGKDKLQVYIRMYSHHFGLCPV